MAGHKKWSEIKHKRNNMAEDTGRPVDLPKAIAGIDHIKDIPANSNSINNGLEDPQPEKGPQGSTRRAIISWLKGWFV
jgi:hypothetical protein